MPHKSGSLGLPTCLLVRVAAELDSSFPNLRTLYHPLSIFCGSREIAAKMLGRSDDEQ
jgi:hypothetical protein